MQDVYINVKMMDIIIMKDYLAFKIINANHVLLDINAMIKKI